MVERSPFSSVRGIRAVLDFSGTLLMTFCSIPFFPGSSELEWSLYQLKFKRKVCPVQFLRLQISFITNLKKPCLKKLLGSNFNSGFNTVGSKVLHFGTPTKLISTTLSMYHFGHPSLLIANLFSRMYRIYFNKFINTKVLIY